jgi:hypothetical protein
MEVIAVGDDSTAALHDGVQTLGDARAQRAHGVAQRAGICRFDNEVQMIALHREAHRRTPGRLQAAANAR